MAKEIKRTAAEVYIDDIATKLLIFDDDVLRRLRRIKMFYEQNGRPTEEIDRIIELYWGIECESPYEGLDNVAVMLTNMANDIPMVSKEIISISDDIKKLKAVIRRINELCG